jgi:hypothetical protein
MTRSCVGCGYCCMQTPCSVAKRLYPGVVECPQLIWDVLDSRYYCGLMKLPEPLGSEYRQSLYAGAGCCSTLNSWRKDIKRRTSTRGMDIVNPIPKLMQIFIKCLAGELMSTDKMELILSRFDSEMEKEGYDRKEIVNIHNNIVIIFNNNRSSFMRGFMG